MRLKLGLSAEAIQARKSGIGGSDAGKLMGGDPAAILSLWEEKTGRKDGEDLSRVLPVQLGSFTEPFNLHWYEMMTGRSVTNEGEIRVHGERSFMRCTLDGLTQTEAGKPAIFQAKHVGPFNKTEEVIQRYMPQVHHEMFCAGLEFAILSVLIGTQGYESIEIARDDFYLAQLIDRETAFWNCVVNDTPPCVLEPIAAPVLPSKFRTVDMTGSNAWASRAAEWLQYRDQAKAFETAVKDIKAMVEPDVGTATGHGIEVKRSKAGALSIKPLKAVKEAA